ncbi:MAG: radical SAM protein [Polyangia bacterium]
MKAKSETPLTVAGLLRAAPRAVNSKPLWAQINVTWQCNLSCAYCSEHDNAKGHVPFADVIARIDKCKELDVLHTDLIGGEPLLHPEIVELVRHVRARGMTTGMTTNGFLLTPDRLAALLDAGIGRMQISVDSLQPTASSPKSLKTLRPKLEMVAKRNLWFYVAAVICDETLAQVQDLAQFCFELGVPIFFAVIHERGRLATGASSPAFLAKLRWIKDQKRAGRPVANPYYLLEYYERWLSGRPLTWCCQGGHKAFYVSPEGDFHYCCHTPKVAPLARITRAHMRENGVAKGCEENCGVDCMIRTSLPFSRRGWALSVEAAERLRGLGRGLTGWLWPDGGKRTSDSSGNSNPGTQAAK